MFDHLSSSPDFLKFRTSLNLDDQVNDANIVNNNNNIGTDLSMMLDTMSIGNNNNINNSNHNNNNNDNILITTTTTTTTTTNTTVMVPISNDNRITLYKPNNSSINNGFTIVNTPEGAHGIFISQHRMLAMHKISISQKKKEYERKMRTIEAYNNNSSSINHRTSQLLESLNALKFSPSSPSSSSPLLIYSSTNNHCNLLNGSSSGNGSGSSINSNKCINNYQECNSLVCTSNCNSSINNNNNNSNNNNRSLVISKRSSLNNSIRNNRIINNSEGNEDDDSDDDSDDKRDKEDTTDQLHDTFDSLCIVGSKTKKVLKKFKTYSPSKSKALTFSSPNTNLVRKVFYNSSPSNLSNLYLH